MNTKNLPNINQSVLAALDFFSQNQPPRLDLKKFSWPLVVGSGNAYNTGQVIFSGQPAIIATESNFQEILKSYQPLIKNRTIKQALVISASGEKDSIWETSAAKKAGLSTTLLTCSPDSRAARLADQVLTYQKLPEPYTYNTSTYLGMILGASGESVQTIKNFLKHLKFPKNFDNYAAYSFILPDEFAAITPMLEIKRHELFGPHLSLRAFSYGEARHAKFVNVWDKELVISLGPNKYFGKKECRWEIKLPASANNGLVLALTYYIVGQIQASKPAYFKKNIVKFCQEGPKAYGSAKPFPVIVE
jgi:hypothetical protein